MSEDKVSYAILQYLKKLDFIVSQYHPPGGQAAFALHLANRYVYPDIIAHNEMEIVLFENKVLYDQGDIPKLLEIRADESSRERVVVFVKAYCRAHGLDAPTNANVIFAHGYSRGGKGVALDYITLAKVDERGDVAVTKALHESSKYLQ